MSARLPHAAPGAEPGRDAIEAGGCLRRDVAGGASGGVVLKRDAARVPGLSCLSGRFAERTVPASRSPAPRRRPRVAKQVDRPSRAQLPRPRQTSIVPAKGPSEALDAKQMIEEASSGEGPGRRRCRRP